MKVTKVSIGFSESPEIIAPVEFNSLEKANSFLSKCLTPEIGYYKTDFTIHFDNGEEYKGRYDIGCDTPTLEEHCFNFSDSMSNGKGFGRYVNEEARELYKRFASVFLGIIKDK